MINPTMQLCFDRKWCNLTGSDVIINTAHCSCQSEKHNKDVQLFLFQHIPQTWWIGWFMYREKRHLFVVIFTNQVQELLWFCYCVFYSSAALHFKVISATSPTAKVNIFPFYFHFYFKKVKNVFFCYISVKLQVKESKCQLSVTLAWKNTTF